MSDHRCGMCCSGMPNYCEMPFRRGSTWYSCNNTPIQPGISEDYEPDDKDLVEDVACFICDCELGEGTTFTRRQLRIMFNMYCDGLDDNAFSDFLGAVDRGRKAESTS